jgi:threonine dehydrogenase-like Zn-dependent dehydrogenase
MTVVRASVLHAAGDVRVEEFTVPETVADDAALLDVEITGICGADVELFRGRGDVKFEPVVLGHEVVGRIREVGAVAAKRWGVSPGDRVVVNEIIPCGRCRLCINGRNELCNGFFGTDGSRYGFIPVTRESGLWGGFGSVMQLHPNSQVWKLSEGVPAPVAAMFMPVSNGVNWVFEIAGVGPGNSILVVGPGPQGLAVTAVGALAGLDVIVAGQSVDKGRLQLAEAVGAVRTVDTEKEDLTAAVRELTAGSGVDAVIVATSGAASVMQMTTRCVRVGGTVVVAGTNGWKSEEGFKTDALVFRDITMRGAPGHTVASVGRAVRLLGRHWRHFEPLAGREFKLDEVATALGSSVNTGQDGGVHTRVRPV